LCGCSWQAGARPWGGGWCRSSWPGDGFALEVLKLRSGSELDPVFKEDHWRVCSALVADCYAYAGADLEQGEVGDVGTGGLEDPQAEQPERGHQREAAPVR
jgi:hypothetical protein